MDSYRRLVLMIALNVPLIVVILLFNLKGVDFSPVTWVYFSAVVLGYYTLSLLVAASLAFLLFCYVRILAVAVGTALVTAAVFLLILDSCTYQVTKIHIDPFWVEWIVHDLEAFGISATTFRTILYSLFGLILLELILLALAGKISRHKAMVLTFALSSVVAFPASQVIHIIGYEKNMTPITALTPHLPVYYPFTSHENAKKFGNMLPSEGEDSSFVSSDIKSTLSYPLHDLEFSIESEQMKPNILVILYESWRYDAMNPKVTPNTYDLSTRSTLCLDHYCANSTVAGLFGLLYGLYPTYWPAVKASNALIDNPVMIDVLKTKGYGFGIFAKSNFERHKIRDTVFRGIEIHESFAGNSIVEQDRDMTRQLLSFFKKQKEASQPFMALAFYKSNHAPYWYLPEDSLFRPAGDQNLMMAREDTDPTRYFNDYLNATHYVDRLVGEVLQELEVLGLMSHTIIIVTTDHGEEFNDNRAGYWGHVSNFTMFQTRVPLIIYGPSREAQRLECRTSHVDVVPTILQEFLGCTNDVGDYSNGANLYQPVEPSRPLVIGSYVTHAFIIDQNVYEINPVQMKSYLIDDIRGEASGRSFEKAQVIFEGISRFYHDDTPVQSGHACSNTGDIPGGQTDMRPSGHGSE